MQSSEWSSAVLISAYKNDIEDRQTQKWPTIVLSVSLKCLAILLADFYHPIVSPALQVEVSLCDLCKPPKLQIMLI